MAVRGTPSLVVERALFALTVVAVAALVVLAILGRLGVL